MRILYFLNRFPKLSLSFILNEIHELENRGHDITIISVHEPDTDLNHEEFNELSAKIYYLDISPTDVYKLLSPQIVSQEFIGEGIQQPSLRYLIGSWIIGKRGLDVVKSNDIKIDLVHSHFATAHAMGGRYISNQVGVPMTLTTHASDIYEHENVEDRDWVLNAMDAVFTISNYNREYLVEDANIVPPTHVIRAAIRYEKFTSELENIPHRILTTARFVEKKGLVYALKGVAKAIERNPEIEYHIIGSGERRELLERVIDREGISESVELLGNVSDERLIRELDGAGIFLLPCVVAKNGDRDGIPVALMEAMAMGAIPISTHVSGIPELIDDTKNGFLTNPRTPHEITNAIDRIITMGDLSSIRENAVQKISNEYSTETMGDILESTFQDLTGSNHHEE